MKQIYKQLTKVTALAGLFLMIAANVDAKMEWTGGASNNPFGSQTVKKTDVPFAIGKTVTFTRVDALSHSTNENEGFWLSNAQYANSRIEPDVSLAEDDNDGSYIMRFFSEINGVIVLRLTHNGSSIPLTLAQLDPYHQYTIKKVQTEATGATGTLITLEVKANTYYAIGYPSGTGGQGKFYIKSAIFLSESLSDYLIMDEVNTQADNLNVAGKQYVLLRRALTANVWNTFCLPCNLSQEELAEQLNIEELYDQITFDGNNISIGQSSAVDYTANEPVFVKPTYNVETPLIILPSINDVSQAGADTKTFDNGVKFIGTLGKEHIYNEAHSNIFLSNKKNSEGVQPFVYPSSDEGTRGWIKGFRAYFELPDGYSVNEYNLLVDDDATGIISVEKFQENGRVYSMDGRYVGNSLENLSRGIYVQNGRKYIVK